MIILITGASSGFGAAMAHFFVKAGHRVIATARRADHLKALGEALGPALYPITLDMRDVGSIAQTINTLPQAWQAIDVLVNNAGLALGVAPAQEASLTDWDEMIATNIRGLVHMTRAILPGMVERKEGLIVNMGSVAGTYPYPGGNVYGATKAFVEQFTLNLRADLIGTGVRVTNVAPGLCGGTEFSQVRYKGDNEAAASVYDHTMPLTAEDIARTVYWIATLPKHININQIELMPVCQSFNGFAIDRQRAV